MSTIGNELTYLINPQYQHQLHMRPTIDLNVLNQEDIDFYKKRIIQTTKDLLNSIDISCNTIIHDSFNLYVSLCITHFKILDTTDIIQTEYDALEKQESNNVVMYETKDLELSNKILFNKVQPKNTIDRCMKINKIDCRTKQAESFPIKKELNLKDPALKYKGIKKKSMSIIIDEKNDPKEDGGK